MRLSGRKMRISDRMMRISGRKEIFQTEDASDERRRLRKR